jgi:hypothetical protein
VDRSDADRLELLDRIADRVPELDLDQNAIEWTTLDHGHEALLVDGAGFDGGGDCFVANHGPDLHVVGSVAPLVSAFVAALAVSSPPSCSVPSSG